jgi:hypothetical protein
MWYHKREVLQIHASTKRHVLDVEKKEGCMKNEMP